METFLDLKKIEALMASNHLNITRLSRRTGLSRQSIYKFLNPDYQPFSTGFRVFAKGLGVDPRQLLLKPAPLDADLKLLLSLAVKGEPRAFELLPASLAQALPTPESARNCSSVELQLLAAASQVALSVKPSPQLEELLEFLVEQLSKQRAFFFGEGVIPLQRSIEVTPDEMKKHRVFGAFDKADFARHFQ